MEKSSPSCCIPLCPTGREAAGNGRRGRSRRPFYITLAVVTGIVNCNQAVELSRFTPGEDDGRLMAPIIFPGWVGGELLPVSVADIVTAYFALPPTCSRTMRSVSRSAGVLSASAAFIRPKMSSRRATLPVQPV
jgi:hypothetical protein